ncbi:hypothetical protein [Desulfocurvus sp.]|uniref:hypothetical protein n=1 Tax=Desulfocurvus sp. TaxID=2871698 RepID=UPI0025C4306A|nr:hypothetical protein [Desulfocurvus sp.]MCK9239604.1 hypothetical protein [Desulfocurvus sp.]
MNANWITQVTPAFQKASLLRASPWMTDGSVDFLRNFCLLRQARGNGLPRILEFGMGAGTLFFASHSSLLVSVEHDKAWHDSVRSIVLGAGQRHCHLLLAEAPYWGVAGSFEPASFDIISIDGRDRVRCLEECLARGLLAQDGVLVLDNTERIRGYDAPYAAMLPLLEQDHTLIHFEQAGPDRTGWLAPHRWVTTVAFRRDQTRYTTQGAPL